MRPAHHVVLAACVALLAGAEVASAAEVAFREPARLHGRQEISGVQEFLATFESSAGFEGHLTVEEQGVSVERTCSYYHVRGPGFLGPSAIGCQDWPEATDQRALHPNGMTIDLSSLPNGKRSLYVVGENLTVLLPGGDVDVWSNEAGTCAWQLDGASERDHTARQRSCAAGPAVLLDAEFDGPILFELRAEGPLAIEWRNARTSCDADPCPSGARDQEVASETQLQAVVNQTLVHHVELTGTLSIWVSGSASRLLAIGNGLDVDLDGDFRLPGYAGELVCPADRCETDGETLIASGNFSLQDLSLANADGMTASMVGVYRSARLDELPLDVRLLNGALLPAAVAGGLVVLWLSLKGALALLTRFPPAKALEHPSRRLIHDYVAANAGPNFREIVRALHLNGASAWHHLGVLKRSGLLMDRRLGNTVRYFENHGRYDANWLETALLRNAKMRELRDWVAGNGPASQSSIIQHFATQGVSRSTVQERLRKLVGAGILQLERAGSAKLYFVRPLKDKSATLHLPARVCPQRTP